MFHKDLANAIGVSPSGLNAVIKQMNAYPVKTINIQDVSKYKLYSMTPVAYRYCMKTYKKEQNRRLVWAPDKGQITYTWAEFGKTKQLCDSYPRIAIEALSSAKDMYVAPTFVLDTTQRKVVGKRSAKRIFSQDNMILKVK